MDLVGVLASESSEKEKMSTLFAGFAARMGKRIIDTEDESTPTYVGKRPRRSSPNEKSYKDLAIIPVDSPDQATNDQLVSKGAPIRVDAPLDEGIPIGGPLVNKIGEESPSGAAAAPLPPLRYANTEPSRRRLPDQLLLSTYLPPYEKIHLPASIVAPNLEGAWEIIHRWSLFNQEDPPVAHMCNLYPNYF